MVTALTLVIAATLSQAPVVLPDTPQGRLVEQFIEAFNSKDRDSVRRLMQANTSAERWKKRTDEERDESYKQLRAQFDTLRITQIVSASETEIVVSIARNDETDTSWSFAFEPGPPVRFVGITVKMASP